MRRGFGHQGQDTSDRRLSGANPARARMRWTRKQKAVVAVRDSVVIRSRKQQSGRCANQHPLNEQSSFRYMH